MAASGVESTADYLDDDYASTEGEDADDSIPQGPLPTLEELISMTPEEEAKMEMFIPIHRPRPTPKEWLREGEHSPLSIPLEACGNIEKGKLFVLSVKPLKWES